MRIGVLGIQGDIREHVASLAALRVDVVVVRKPDELNGLSGLVIPGGESTTMSILGQRFGLIEPMRLARANGLPMFGTCAGLIMLANEISDGRPDQRTIGGLDIVAQRNAFGRQVDSFETDLSIPVLGAPPFHAVFIRAPVVASFGKQVEVLATTDDGRAVMVQQDQLLATSFHPELTDDRRIHDYFLKMVRAA